MTIANSFGSVQSKVFFGRHSQTVEDRINEWLLEGEFVILDCFIKLITDRDNKPCILVSYLYTENRYGMHIMKGER